MTVTERVVRNVIRKLLRGEDYRSEVTEILDASFLQVVTDFCKEAARAKQGSKASGEDWYRKGFLGENLASDDLATNAGLNMKTIRNRHKSGKRQVVRDAVNQHYDALKALMQDLAELEPRFDLTLAIKNQGAEVAFTMGESLLLMNTLAVKRAALRGGLWSTTGKQVEKPLMRTLCMLYDVPEAHYSQLGQQRDSAEGAFTREVDFFLASNAREYRCEVKLMGKGNPESADAFFARSSQVFIADTLSQTNKSQLDSHGVHWVELSSPEGFRKFANVLDSLQIPHAPLPDNLDTHLEQIFSRLFGDTN